MKRFVVAPTVAEALRVKAYLIVQRRVERYLAYREPDPVGTLFRLAIDRARSQTERIAAP